HLDVVLTAGKGALEKKRRPIKADTSALNAFWALDAGDVTGDGKADIIAVGTKSGSSDTIALVLPGKGDGTFPSAFVATTNYEANGNAADVAFGAFQGRGTLGFVIYAWEGPESYMHVYSGRCK
ncbi:MAG TPA: VCBS repeat-containing protein, partial [Kofleriaceae bacterium]|nr:VCBS repeat-containing protein [Kofleriaceae bacterium]